MAYFKYGNDFARVYKTKRLFNLVYLVEMNTGSTSTEQCLAILQLFKTLV